MNNRLVTSDRISWAMLLSACVLQIVMGSLLARTTIPLCDEGFYGVPAHIFSVTGSLRNPVMESAGVSYLRGIDQHFYWMVPVGMLLQSAAFKVFGLALSVQRELSVAFALGAVLMWYWALRHLLGNRVAALASLLLSLDFVFLSLACRGRSDMISLFFGMAALAGYMHWRERSMAVALAVSNTACALSGLVHPNVGIAAVASLFILILYLDRSRLRWSHLGVVAACYGVLGLSWGLYIAKAPDLFVAQFFGNVAGRLGGPMTLTRLIKGEVTRYLSAYGLTGAHGAKLVRFLLPASYLSSIAFCVLSRDLRRRSGVLLLMFGAVSLTLLFLEGAKQGWYLLPLSPFFCVFLAITANELWRSGNILGRTVTAAQMLIVLFGVASHTYSATGRSLERLYEPTVAFLNDHITPQDLVFARSEFYFGLKCRTCLRDDVNLGALSGIRPDYIVLDQDYLHYLDEYRQMSPAMYHDIEQRLSTEYKEVFRNPAYSVMQKTKSTH